MQVVGHPLRAVSGACTPNRSTGAIGPLGSGDIERSVSAYHRFGCIPLTGIFTSWRSAITGCR